MTKLTMDYDLKFCYQIEGPTSVPLNEASSPQANSVTQDPTVITTNLVSVLSGFPEAFRDIRDHQRDDPKTLKGIRH